MKEKDGIDFNADTEWEWRPGGIRINGCGSLEDYQPSTTVWVVVGVITPFVVQKQMPTDCLIGLSSQPRQQ